MPAKDFQPGSLVRLRNREWVVMPSGEDDLLLVKPLGGSDDETTGIYLPLALPYEKPEPAVFPPPSAKDIGSFTTANLLYNAARLSFRSAAGPFRCIGKLSFRPRAYQLVPLIMALSQNPIRLFIADDVGVGKTVEALLIARELLDRGEIKRMAVVCLPHLCEQWQKELREKFSVDAVIIRSSTAAQLDRKIQGDASIFRQYPFQIISIDFIKSGPKKEIFLNEAPEFIIVDEAHSCARPAGASVSQMQRYHIIYELAKKKEKHLLLLTATPHSGKQAEFQSLLGLLNPEFEKIALLDADAEHRKHVARHLVIRRRADIEAFYENTPFPKRDSREVEYALSEDYKTILSDLLSYARRLEKKDVPLTAQKKFRYLALLSLFRGIMSSPLAGMQMLAKKERSLSVDDDSEESENPVLAAESSDSDTLPVDLMEKSDLLSSDAAFFRSIAARLSVVKDHKAEAALQVVLDWLKNGYNPVIFCRFIDTAIYLGDYLKEKLPKNIDLIVITGLMVDEQRKEKIDALDNSSNRRVLVSTDCLSEGINLQKLFTAVLHYDLPWNPNRLEQREGRVDRFGQPAPEVKAYLLWGKDNPIDSVVLRVLLRKAKEIRRQTGISVPFPDDSQSILDSLLNAVILNPAAASGMQLDLGFAEDDISTLELKVTDAYEKAGERDKQTRSIFSQQAISSEEIEKDLKDIDEAVGNPEAVKKFVTAMLLGLGGQVQKFREGYRAYITNLPEYLKPHFAGRDENLITFDSPVPEGYRYIGRNSHLVEQLSHYVMNSSLLGGDIPGSAARASVIAARTVTEKIVIMQLRVRNIISDKKNSSELVAEEMILWGYTGSLTDNRILTHDECRDLLDTTTPADDLSRQRKEIIFNRELDAIMAVDGLLSSIVRTRSQKLIEAHERFRKLLGGSRYQVVEPVVPPDILGIYIIMPVLL